VDSREHARSRVSNLRRKGRQPDEKEGDERRTRHLYGAGGNERGKDAHTHRGQHCPRQQKEKKRKRERKKMRAEGEGKPPPPTDLN